MQSCGIAPTDPHSRVVETTACSGGARVTGATVGQGCVEQGCAARCTHDGDCPSGTLCSEQYVGKRVCTASRLRHLAERLPCPPPGGGS